MGEQYITMTNDCSDYVYVDYRDIINVTGGLKPHADAIKWYNPPSQYAEYYNEYHEYDRMDLSDGKSNNDEVLDDGRYNPGYRYIIYSSLKPTTVKVRPSQIKDVISRVYTSTKDQDMPATVLRQIMAKEVAMHMSNLSIKNLICVIEDLNDVIALEDIFAVSEAVDPVEHDILKNEIKLYVFDPNLIHRASEEKKHKAYMDIKTRLETGFYRKKINFLDMLRWDKNMEPKEREMFLRCGVYPEEREEPERTYDRIKLKLQEVYNLFDRYKNDYVAFKANVFRKIQKPVSPERNEWDERYNDEVIPVLTMQGVIRYFSAIYISKDSEKNIVLSTDERRRFRYGRVYNVNTLGVFDSTIFNLDKVLDIEELRLKNLKAKEQEKKAQEQEQEYPIIR